MSIIHDALKKVQRGLSSKIDRTPASASTVTQTASGYIYETPPQNETLSQGGQQTINQKMSMKNKIKSLLILLCALVITVACILYIFQQFQSNIPRVRNFAQRSFFQLIRKSPVIKTTPTEDLKPLAQFTVNPSALSKMNKPPAPVTLNIHGIMSNGSGNLVLINDQVYQEGDDIDGAKIVKINLDSITVDNNGIEQTILVKN